MLRRKGSMVLPLIAMLVAVGSTGCGKTTTGQPDFGIDDAVDDADGDEGVLEGVRVTITNPPAGSTTPVSGTLDLGVLVESDQNSAITLTVDVLKAGTFTTITQKLPKAQAVTIPMDTMLIPDGRKWSVRVTATRDTDGVEGTATAQITVDNGGPSITPKTPTPVEGGSILGDLTVRFVVKDPGAGVQEIKIDVSEGDTLLGTFYSWPPEGTKAPATQVDTQDILVPTGSWSGGDKTLTVTATDALGQTGSFVLNFSYLQRPRFQGGTLFALPQDFTGAAIAGIRLGLPADNTSGVVVASATGLAIFLRDAGNETLVKGQDLLKVGCTSVSVRKVDLDDLEDVVAICSPATGTGRNVNIFLQTDGSTFAKPVTVALPANVEALALGDLNQDGVADVAVAMPDAPQTVGVSLSGTTEANALVWGAIKTYGGAQAPRFIAIGQFGDLTGEGETRETAVFVAPSGSANATRFISDASGVLSAGLNGSLGTGESVLTRITATTAYGLRPSDPPTMLAFGDGDRDKIQLVRAENNLSAPTALNLVWPMPAGVQPSRIVAGDVNSDGLNDLAVLCRGGNLVHLFPGNIPPTTKEFLFQGPSYLVGPSSDLTLVDLDDDGRLDVVTLSQDGKVLTWLKNENNLAFGGAPMVSIGLQPISMAVGRFSKALAGETGRFLDVALLGTVGSKNVIHVFTSELASGMALTPASNNANNPIAVDVPTPRKLLSANVDPYVGTNPGLDDLVVSSSFIGPTSGKRVTGKVYVIREDGLSHSTINATGVDQDWGDSPSLVTLGTFTNQVATSTPWRPDLAAIATFGKAVQIRQFINQKDGTFTTKLNNSANTQGQSLEAVRTPHDLVAAPLRLRLDKWDFTQPGQRVVYDALSPDTTTGDFTVYPNAGEGFFQSGPTRFKHFAVGANPKMVAVGFLAVPIDGSLPADQQAKALPDVATLLDQDVVISYNTSPADDVQTNPDLLSFDPPVPLGHAGHGPVDFALADMNHDGFVDIAILNSGDSTVSIYLNLGSRIFSAPYTIATGANPQEMSIADLDGNGCPDIVTVDTAGKTLTFLKNVITCPK